MKNKICAIIVLYNPSLEQIQNKFTLACDKIIFLDNSPSPDADIQRYFSETSSQTVYFPFGENVGIATAQNKGISLALKEGTTHLVFLDQDSTVQKTYCEDIVAIYGRLKDSGVNVGILGPLVMRQSGEGEYKSKWYTQEASEDGFIESSEVISSGSCVDASFVLDVGGLDNSLFIDFVDHEWGFRAKAHGYKVGKTNKITLEHKIGENEFHLWKYQSLISAPWRYFYIGRNIVWLSRRKYVPFSFKVKKLIHIIIQTIFYPFMVKGGLKIIRNYYRGIAFGITHKNKPDFHFE